MEGKKTATKRAELSYFWEKLGVEGVDIQDPRTELARRHTIPILPLAGRPRAQRRRRGLRGGQGLPLLHAPQQPRVFHLPHQQRQKDSIFRNKTIRNHPFLLDRDG